MFGILVGSKEKAIVFPAEVCTVVEGQIYKKKVPQELTPQVVKFATSPPGDRLAAIQQSGGARAPVSKEGRTKFNTDNPFRYLNILHRLSCKTRASVCHQLQSESMAVFYHHRHWSLATIK
jgi:hypothetical protein